MKNEKWQQKCEKLNSHQTGRWETSISQELIRLPENLTKETAKHLVEFALWKGFFAVSAVFPVVSRKEGIKVPDCLSFCQNVMPIEERPDFYEAASNHAFPIPDLDWRKKKGLESIFAKGIFLKDTNHDLLPDALDCRIVLPEEVDESIVIAAANLAYRLGMETTAYEGAIREMRSYWREAVNRRTAGCGWKKKKDIHLHIFAAAGSSWKSSLHGSARNFRFYPAVRHGRTVLWN